MVKPKAALVSGLATGAHCPPGEGGPAAHRPPRRFKRRATAARSGQGSASRVAAAPRPGRDGQAQLPQRWPRCRAGHAPPARPRPPPDHSRGPASLGQGYLLHGSLRGSVRGLGLLEQLQDLLEPLLVRLPLVLHLGCLENSRQQAAAVGGAAGPGRGRAEMKEGRAREGARQCPLRSAPALVPPRTPAAAGETQDTDLLPLLPR